MGVVTLHKRAFVVGAILLLFGCADPIDGAKKTLEDRLSNNFDVEYRNTRGFPGDVVCGEVDNRDRWGNGRGYQRFIVRADRAYTTPSEDDWGIFCNEDPAAALQARFGIDPMGSENNNLQTVYRQLNEMDLALRQYLTDNKAFPQTTEELLSQGGYIDKIPEDPWGRPYHYEQLRLLHPAPKAYKLYTLGRDGVAGGTGEDADIGNWHLRYIGHVANL
jgi:general secretion pathway protein G